MGLTVADLTDVEDRWYELLGRREFEDQHLCECCDDPVANDRLCPYHQEEAEAWRRERSQARSDYYAGLI